MSADKKTVSPSGLLPSWANNLNIVDGGKPWDGTPTKVEPGAGKRDAGFRPDEKPEAQHLDQLFAELGQWVQFFSDLQVQNWQDMGAPQEPAMSTNTAEFVIADDGMGGSGGWVVGGRAGVMTYSIDEQNWKQPVTMAAPTLTWGAAVPLAPGNPPGGNDGNWIAGGSGAATIFQYPNATDDAIAGAGAFSNDGVFVPGISKFVAVGKADAVPTIWYATLTGSAVGAWTKVNLVPNNSVQVLCVAVNTDTGRIVAWGDGTNGDLFWSDNGTVWFTQNMTLGAGGTFKSVKYDPVRKVFVLLCHHRVYTSSDGLTWTSTGADITPFDFQVRCFAVMGGHYVAATHAGGPVLLFSTDGGVKWRAFSAEVGKPTIIPIHAIAYSQVRRRLLLTWADSPNSGRVVRSLSVGTTQFDTGGLANPKVT